MYQIEDIKNTILFGDSLTEIKKIPNESIDTVITSPPYFNLRDYGIDGQIGLEKTYQEFISKLVSVFIEVKRVLKKEGTLFVNIADTYNGNKIGNTSEKWDKINNDSFTKEKEVVVRENNLYVNNIRKRDKIG